MVYAQTATNSSISTTTLMNGNYMIEGKLQPKCITCMVSRATEKITEDLKTELMQLQIQYKDPIEQKLKQKKEAAAPAEK